MLKTTLRLLTFYRWHETTFHFTSTFWISTRKGELCFPKCFQKDKPIKLHNERTKDSKVSCYASWMVSSKTTFNSLAHSCTDVSNFVPYICVFIEFGVCILGCAGQWLWLRRPHANPRVCPCVGVWVTPRPCVCLCVCVFLCVCLCCAVH